MKCNICGTLFAASYKKCPHCHSDNFEKEKKVIQVIHDEEIEKISPYVTNGDITDFDGNI